METTKSIDKETIPMGDTSEDIKQRKKLIEDYYRRWQADNPGKRVYTIATFVITSMCAKSRS